MRVRSNRYVLAVLIHISAFALARSPGDTRTILTSGEKVHTIWYQLGQSTVIFLGFKPETVICGNKNYFNIEKIKDGVTIQPLSNFSTNLTIIDGSRRFLFYLSAAAGSKADAFVDVKWIPNTDTKQLPLSGVETVHMIGLKAKVSREVELSVVRELQLNGNRVIEVQVRNSGASLIKLNEMSLAAVSEKSAISRQTTIFDKDELQPGGNVAGRIIASAAPKQKISLMFTIGSIKQKIHWKDQH